MWSSNNLLRTLSPANSLDAVGGGSGLARDHHRLHRLGGTAAHRRDFHGLGRLAEQGRRPHTGRGRRVLIERVTEGQHDLSLGRGKRDALTIAGGYEQGDHGRGNRLAVLRLLL